MQNGGKLVYQGSNDDGGGTQVRVYVNSLPVWFMIICICVLLCLSGLFSGKLFYLTVFPHIFSAETIIFLIWKL